MPHVSIIVPNYNYAGFLGERLDSIANQTFHDYEIILLDDGSSDQSVAILRRFASHHQSRLVCNQTNSGNPFVQWNKGLALATGQYVWIAEADDYADPCFLDTLVCRLDNNPRCGIAYCNSFRVDADSRILELAAPTMYDVDLTRWSRDFIASGREERFRYLLRENTIPSASAVLFRRDLYTAVGPVDDSLSLTADWAFWASILRLGDLAFVAKPLNYFRTHPATTRARARNWRVLQETFQVMMHILADLDTPRNAIEDLHARVAFLILHALFTERPTRDDLDIALHFMATIRFRVTSRAARSFCRQVFQALSRRLRGIPQQRFRT